MIITYDRRNIFKVQATGLTFFLSTSDKDKADLYLYEDIFYVS